MNKNNKVVILGAYGLLGSYLSKSLEKNFIEVFKQGRKDSADYKVCPTDNKQVRRFLKEVKPNIIINLNALTRLDECESFYDEAYKANVKTVEVLLEEIDPINTHLIHLSTDHVHDGKGPHSENDINIINNYASTKYQADLLVNDHGGTVLRTNFIGRSYQKGRISFTDWLYNAMYEDREINLFEDVKFNAVHQSFLSSIIMSCILRKPQGIYNIASNGSISKSSFAIKLAEYLNFNSFKYKLISSKDLGRLARRSKDMTLDNNKAKEFFNIEFPSLDETLRLVSNDYKNLFK